MKYIRKGTPFLSKTWQPDFIIFLAALYTFCVTFLTERFIFSVENRMENLLDYVLCKALQLVFLFLIYRFFYRALLEKDHKESREYHILLHAIPFLLYLIPHYLIKTKIDYRGDELNIFNSALKYEDMSSWFNYQTGYFHIISLMTFPIYRGPIIAKFLVQSLSVGYTAFRFHQYFKNRGYLLIYVLFIASRSMIGQAMNISRTPIYGIVFVFFFTKLLFDYLEHKELTKGSLLGLCALAALLTQWRNEGIGLLLFAPLILLSAYAIQNKKMIYKTVGLLMVLQLAVFIPQSVDTYSADPDFAATRMRPFYNYVLTNMLRNGLDREKYSEQLAIADKYVSIDAIDKINNDFGTQAYDDEYVYWKEGYQGIREDATLEDYLNYTKAAQEIILGSPLLFIRSQLGAFHYTSMKYFPTSMSKPIQWHRFFSYQLYVPVFFMILVFFGSLKKKQWFHFFMSAAVLCQTCVTLLLMPAAIFNYFYVVYTAGYLYLFCWLIRIVTKVRFEHSRDLVS